MHDAHALMEGLVEKANRALVQNEGDFIHDGLLHCGVCGGKKQTRIFGAVIVRCNCACDESEYQKKCKVQREQEEADRKQRYRSTCIKSQEYIGATFDSDDHANPAVEYVRQYASEFDQMSSKNIGLLLYGGVGTGKSFAAACVANYLIDHGIPAMMSNFATILNSLCDSDDKNAVIDDLVGYPLLILDDFGMERGTSFGLEQVFSVIDSRKRTGKPLIVTTNLSLSELDNPTDTMHKRIYSRIKEMCTPINFGCVDRREEISRRKFSEAVQILRGGDNG